MPGPRDGVRWLPPTVNCYFQYVLTPLEPFANACCSEPPSHPATESQRSGPPALWLASCGRGKASVPTWWRMDRLGLAECRGSIESTSPVSRVTNGFPQSFSVDMAFGAQGEAPGRGS